MPDMDIQDGPPDFETNSPTDSAPSAGYYHTPSLPHSSTAGIGKRRKNSKIKMSPILKRASSTPQLNGLSVEESGGLSPSALDKRRNKLGYQRISIACSHCRRRKIRCVLAEADDMGRCNNCIRLKKECVFYPVDSAGGPESRAQTKGSKDSSVNSNSPSEMHPPGTKLEHDREMGRFPHLASNAPTEYGSVDPSTGLGISTGSKSAHEKKLLRSQLTILSAPVASEFAFARPGYPAIYAGDVSGTEPPTPVHWSSSQMGEYSNYSSTTAEHSPNVYPSFSFPPQRDEYAMQQPPMRSMSYGHIEPQLQSFAPSVTPIEYARPGSSHYNLAPLDTGATPVCTIPEASMTTPVTSEPTMTPIGMYPTQWGFYPQQQQPSMGMDYSSRHDSLPTQWYHPQHLGPTMTEHELHHQHQHPMSQAPGGAYAKRS
ncbi:hypothetical protein E4T39_08819 [Aureobasidium subglaciale]|nr:hypothetical protein E4T39_08819 [Aureobasidium subglaciale]